MKNWKDLWLKKWDNVVVKVWSNILAWNGTNKHDQDYGINISNIQNVVNSVEYLMNRGLNVFLVSSWAVAVGRREFEKNWVEFEKELTQDQKAFLSGNGQIMLMKIYHDLFMQKNILVTQNLLTHYNFKAPHILENLANVWKQNVKYKTLAIINENDTISREELKFSDNDELAWYVAKEVQAKVLFLLSDIDGIYKNFWTQNQQLIDEVNNIGKVSGYCVENNWKTHGSGGMWSKLKVMKKMMDNNITWIITNGWEQDGIRKIIEWDSSKKTIFRK